MHNYDYITNYSLVIDAEILSLVAAIRERKGSLDLATVQENKVLEALVEIAKIQSTDASNRIEGIVSTDDRIKSLVLQKTKPKNRAEREIAGYSTVLEMIHESYNYIQVNTNHILELHSNMLKVANASYAGSFKKVDNEIAEYDTHGNKHTRFKTVPAFLTESSMQELCDALNYVLSNTDNEPLIVIPMFILDFLCIHPFKDGNGRMSRLLTLLLLYKTGFLVGKYVSIEKLIADNKSAYYDSLQKSSDGWQDNKNDYKPFIVYMLKMVLAAYNELFDRTDIIKGIDKSKPERIEEFMQKSIGKVNKSQILTALPDISQTTVNRTLAKLKNEGKIKLVTSGRYASYIWVADNK